MARQPNTPADILSRYTIDSNGCWLYSGGTCNGYPVAKLNGKQIRVHRLSYQHYVGPIPDGMTLDHVCHSNDSGCRGGLMCSHRKCFNPGHLEPVDGVTNTMRGQSPSAIHARQTVCSRGHRLMGANTYAYRGRNGRRWRACRTCKRLHDKRRKQRLAALKLAA